jgi:hypothetical protein
MAPAFRVVNFRSEPAGAVVELRPVAQESSNVDKFLPALTEKTIPTPAAETIEGGVYEMRFVWPNGNATPFEPFQIRGSAEPLIVIRKSSAVVTADL